MRFLATAALLAAMLATACGGGSRSASGTDLEVTGFGPAGTVVSGSTVKFNMSVTNVGDREANDIRIVDQVGNQLALTGIVCSAAGGATCPATTGPSMTVPAMPAGGVLRFEVSATVGATGAGTITVTNTMTATIADDINRGDNSFTAQAMAYTPNAGVFVTGVGPVAAAPAGGIAAFVMTVTNAGPDAATNLHIVDTVGGNLTLTGVTCIASAGSACPAALGPVMDVPALPARGVLTFTITAVVAAGNNGVITNALSATPDNDPDRSDNTAVAVGSAYAYNIGVTASGPTDPVAGGATALFTMVVTNNGPATALDVVVTDTVGANLTLLGIGCAASGGATCPAVSEATMVVPSIPAGGVLTLTVSATVSAGANGTVTNVLSAVGMADSRAADNAASATAIAVSADLGVSQTGPATIGAGTSAVFTAVIANPGPGPATNLTVTETLTAGYAAAIICVPSVGATCPGALGPVIAVPSLPAGRALTFIYTVPVPTGARGSLVNTVQVAADVDPNLANNVSTVTTLIVDPRSGAYKLYAANGFQYDLSIDFDASRYMLVGNGLNVQRTFTESGGEFTLGGSGTARFRVATDLLVGSENFGQGILPYVAARRFSTSINDLGGLYDLATRNVAANGSVVTHAGTARVSGNVLQVCQTSTGVYASQDCPIVLKTYLLSVAGDLFTGVDQTTGEVYSFRLARTGASSVFLSAGSVPDGTQQFRTGIPESAGLAWGVVRGPTQTGDWVTITLNPTLFQYTVLGTTTSDSAGLQKISNSGPFAVMSGIRADGGTIYVMQATPLVVVIGDAVGPANGTLQLALP